jgi:hypothetical protein
MSTPTKIYELKGEDFTKGLSYSTNFPVGGLYSSASTFDPFEDYGYHIPSLDAVVTDSSLTYTPTVLTSVNISGVAYIYCHTPTKLFKVLDGTPWTTTDVTSSIDVASPVTGAIIFKNKYIYAQSAVAKVYADPIDVTGGATVTIFDSGGSSSELYTPFCVAPDKNLYFGIGDIGRITDVTTTNNGSYYTLESGFYVRDLVNDGHYLVAIADNNSSHKVSSNGVSGNYRCQVLFYDVNNGRSTADYIYEFTDSYVTSVKYLDGAVYIFGKDNLWICNSQTAPKAIFSFKGNTTITEPPERHTQVTVKGNSIHWVADNNNTYAYGSMVAGQKKVFYSPYYTSSNQSCITNNGTNFYIGNDGANQMLQVTGTGSTRQLATLATAKQFLPQPYKFAFAKVIMKAKLSSGGSVYLGMTTSDGNITFASTKVFSTIGAKQAILFDIVNDTTASVKEFNDFILTVGANKAIARVEVWAYPIDSYDQTV